MPGRKPRKKPTLYLAGPISGCNPDQVSHWRRRAKARWSQWFEFIDPTERMIPHGEGRSYQVVREDQRAIAKSDAVLANMWKESVGTAIGIATARTKGKTVVVMDPCRLNSVVVAYYADAVVPRLPEAIKTIRSLLKAQDALKTVIKHSGSEEKFSRDKLTASIRKACRAAGQDDVLAPVEIIPRTIEKLVQSPRRISGGALPSRYITETVWDVLAELEADPLRGRDFEGIRNAWESYDRKRHGPGPPTAVAERREARIRNRSLSVRVYSQKSHATIWGKTVKTIQDIPQPARQVFKEITRVEGIAEIRLTRMKKGLVVQGTRVDIVASKSDRIIEGKCYHNAPKGQIQMFQIRVHDSRDTDSIRKVLLQLLGQAGFLRM